MELFQWGTDPWGQEILIRVSWDLLYLSFWAGVAFIIFHVIYTAVWLPKLAREAAGGEGSAGVAGIPDRVERHTLADRDVGALGDWVFSNYWYPVSLGDDSLDCWGCPDNLDHLPHRALDVFP